MVDLVWADAATPDEGAAQTADLLRDAFGYEPRGMWGAPGRVNITGKHADYNGGLCAPIALSHRAYVVLSPCEDRTIRPISPQMREAIDILDLDVIGPKGTPGEIINHWIAYLAGATWVPKQAGYGPLPGFDVALQSRMPLRGGLSSSVALECATAVALDEVCSLGPAGTIEAPNDEGRKVLVDAARAAENQAAGANTSGLDQTASLHRREGHALTLDCHDMLTRQAPFDLGAVGLELLVIGTCVEHSLVDDQYGSHCVGYEESVRILGASQLVEAEDPGETTAALGDERLTVRTYHVVSEIARTRAFIEFLDEGPLGDTCLTVAGVLLNDSHDSLRDDYEVSCKELDVAVEAVRAAGTHGVRMTGGGFGESVTALIDTHVVEGVARAVVVVYAGRGWKPPHFIRSLPGAPAGRLD